VNFSPGSDVSNFLNLNFLTRNKAMPLHPASFTNFNTAIERRNRNVRGLIERYRRARTESESLGSSRQYAVDAHIRSMLNDPVRYSRDVAGKSYAELVEQAERELGFRPQPAKGDVNARVRERIEYYSRRNQWKPYAEILAEVQGS
jgi:hypothetical protein